MKLPRGRPERPLQLISQNNYYSGEIWCDSIELAREKTCGHCCFLWPPVSVYLACQWVKPSEQPLTTWCSLWWQWHSPQRQCKDFSRLSLEQQIGFDSGLHTCWRQALGRKNRDARGELSEVLWNTGNCWIPVRHSGNTANRGQRNQNAAGNSGIPLSWECEKAKVAIRLPSTASHL